MKRILSPFKIIVRNLPLIYSLVRKEIKVKYSGSVFGLIWAVIMPLVMLCVYTFVFSVVFQARWGQLTDSRSQFALILFAGLILFNLFSESISSSSYSITGNENYVKKVIFPLEIMPVVSVFVVLFHFLVSFAVLLVFSLIIGNSAQWSIVFTPILLASFLLFTIGISWLTASLSVYLRDIPYFVTIICSLLLFLSPIFYSIMSVPVEYRSLLLLNPLTPYIEVFRELVIFGKTPTLWTSVYCLSSGFIFFYIGFFVFF